MPPAHTAIVLVSVDCVVVIVNTMLVRTRGRPLPQPETIEVLLDEAGN